MGKKIIVILLAIFMLLAAGFYFLGRPKTNSSLPAEESLSESASTPTSGTTIAPHEKRGDTTKTGNITASGGRFFLTEAGSSPKEIESYALDLADYVGQTVTVTGQYSGDTLFVGSIQ